MIDLEAVRRISLLDEAEIFLELENDPAIQVFGAAPNRKNSDGSFGRAYLEARLAKLRERVCSHSIVKQKLGKNETKHDDELLCAIADTIIQVLGGIAIVYLTALIVKRGLAEFCKEVQVDH
jgi:hypothetical protein